MGCITIVGSVIWALAVLVFNLANMILMLAIALIFSIPKLVVYPFRRKSRDETMSTASGDTGNVPGRGKGEGGKGEI